MSDETTRAGMVAIVGLPNAGKSSLLNALLGTKLAIVTSAAQTTRERVVGIDTRDGAQIIFLDTPGVVEPRYLLHHAMVEAVRRAIADADAVVLLLDGTREPPVLPDDVTQALRALEGGLVVAVNKVDVAKPSTLERLRRWAADAYDAPIVEISALRGEGIDRLRALIVERLPVSPFLYSDDDLSTQNLRFFVAELVRETVFEKYSDEIPYSTAVRVEEFRESDEPIYIRATIFVERPTQKGIILGEKGSSIRELGTAARMKIEAFLDRRVYLDLWVKVLPKWRKRSTELRRFGFPVPPGLGT